MPIWFEILVLSLIAYAVGLGLGWALWGRARQESMTMVELVQANWVVLVAALVIGLIVAWFLLVSSRRTRVEIEPKDEAAGPATRKRNQALIDAPPAAAGRTVGDPAAARDMAPSQPAMPPSLAGAGAAIGASALPLSSAADQATAVPAAPLAPQPQATPPLRPVPDTQDAAPEPPPAAFPVPPDQDMHTIAPGEQDDDLTRIKGLGPKLEAQLRTMGITSLAQIAGWSETDIDRIDAGLGRFQGRIRRDDWREQARLLAAGDNAAYEARFGRL